MWKVRCVLDTVWYDRICQWIVAGQRSTWYSLIWYNLSVNCGKSDVYLIQFDMIVFVSELWQVRGVLDTSLCDRICQWIVAGQRCTWYIFMWWSLSVNCGRSEVYLIHLYVIEFVSELWQVRGVLDTVWYDIICQWIVEGQMCTWYSLIW